MRRMAVGKRQKRALVYDWTNESVIPDPGRCERAKKERRKNMNQVFISGIIADRPRLTQPENGAAHLMFALSVRHRTAKGVVKQELYTVNAWNRVALWGAEQLAQGQLVAMRGYLTQHARENGVLAVEITAEEFLLSARKTGGQEREQKQDSPPAQRRKRSGPRPRPPWDGQTAAGKPRRWEPSPKQRNNMKPRTSRIDRKRLRQSRPLLSIYKKPRRGRCHWACEKDRGTFAEGR